MPFELNIVTPQGQAFAGPVDGIVLPGSEGEFGVLPNHERFLTPLATGEVEITTGDGTVYAAIAGGFAEVQGDQVAVLVESCELAADIDVARAERARVRAEEGLAATDADAERARFEQFEAALARAKNRLEVGGR
ncbi:MAG: ATP synthase F1 subunit epsilon [Myxococcota bacterium]